MSIIIKPAVPDSPRQQFPNGGFTLPEVLVSLCILLLLLQMVWQWGQLAICSEERMQQNQQAILLAKTILAGLQPELPEGWSFAIKEKQGAILQETDLDVFYGTQHWQFYYAKGQLELADEG